VTVLVDDPLLTLRDVYRERPLTRVIFDRRLRISPDARIFSTLSAGPIIVVTSCTAAHGAPYEALLRRGATLASVTENGIDGALRELAQHGIQSVVLEGGATLHKAAWDAGLVDYVQLYVAPVSLGARGIPLLDGSRFSSTLLFDRKVDQLGPDVLIEGYVHRPH